MIRKILLEIKDPADYTSALTLLRQVGPNAALSTDEWAALLALYTKYMPAGYGAEDPEFVKLCLAADVMMVMPEAGSENYDALGLGADDLDALFCVREISNIQEDMSTGQAQDIVELAGKSTLSDPAKTVLARAALDAMVCSRYYPEIQGQIVTLAEYLSGRGADELDRCSDLLEEVRMKCKR